MSREERAVFGEDQSRLYSPRDAATVIVRKGTFTAPRTYSLATGDVQDGDRIRFVTHDDGPPLSIVAPGQNFRDLVHTRLARTVYSVEFTFCGGAWHMTDTAFTT